MRMTVDSQKDARLQLADAATGKGKRRGGRCSCCHWRRCFDRQAPSAAVGACVRVRRASAWRFVRAAFALRSSCVCLLVRLPVHGAGE
jgi:hypothetical protein